MSLCRSTKPVIAVAFYSTYGHIGALAEEVIKGVEASGAVVKPYVIKETLPEEVLTKMHAGSSLSPKYPVITPNDLEEVDGLILGAPTRYGRVPAQVDAFFDATGGLWAKGGLVGKFVTMFTSTAGQHSGQESTFLTTYPFFAHHGMVYVPIGYANQSVGSLEQVSGGSPYGATTIAGADGSRKPLPIELEIAQFQGKFFADFVTTFTKGKNAAIAPAAASTAEASTSTPVVPVAAKEVPVLAAPVAITNSANETSTTKEAGYTVDSAPTTSEATATATPAEEVAEKPAAAEVRAPAEKATAEPASAATKEATPAAATTTPAPAAAAAAATPAPAKKDAPKKKKGFFASCCGDSGIDK
ncbi:NAD(P)H:quinone oxidoreductase, type IV [Kwoniella sp. CBS 6097]